MDVLYIDLLKKVLTNTLFQEEPDINEEEHSLSRPFLSTTFVRRR